jgi:hypothetical protein
LNEPAALFGHCKKSHRGIVITNFWLYF